MNLGSYVSGVSLVLLFKIAIQNMLVRAYFSSTLIKARNQPFPHSPKLTADDPFFKGI